MIVKLKHLLLEVTRRCDMTCRHCMRGDAEDLSMGSEATASKWMKSVRRKHKSIYGVSALAVFFIHGLAWAPSSAFS